MRSNSNLSSENHDRSMVRLAPSTAGLAPLPFQSAHGFATRALAHMLDSLVRVSRRVGGPHFVSIVVKRTPRSAPRHGTWVKDADTRRSRAALPPQERVPAAPTDADYPTQGARRREAARPAQGVLGPPASLLAISSTFNSLFKVLFIFPSRYLFAIGLSLLFSFRWDLPPA